MKIISQSTDELVLKEGSTSGIAIGVAFVIAGGFIAYRFHSSNPVSILSLIHIYRIGRGRRW